MPEKFKKETKKKSKPIAAKKPVSKKNLKYPETIKALEIQIEEINDKYLRLKAEFDNFRRRKENELISLPSILRKGMGLSPRFFVRF